MARYKDYSYEQTKMIPLCLPEQIRPGTFDIWDGVAFTALTTDSHAQPLVKPIPRSILKNGRFLPVYIRPFLQKGREKVAFGNILLCLLPFV